LILNGPTPSDDGRRAGRSVHGPLLGEHGQFGYGATAWEDRPQGDPFPELLVRQSVTQHQEITGELDQQMAARR
jgi:hypothetical protein